VIARVMRLGAVFASLANASVLAAQPNTEGLADVSERRPRFGVDIGGTAGPLSPFQQANANEGWIEQAAVLSYVVRSRDRRSVRGVAWLYRSERLIGYGTVASSEYTNRTTERMLALGGLVDMFDTPLSRTRLRRIRVVGALGGGVVPYATTRDECTGCSTPGISYRRQDVGAGVLLAGSIGLRWKRLAIDQQLMSMLVSGNAMSTLAAAAPVTMGVRF
jgi:hypothetical protein